MLASECGVANALLSSCDCASARSVAFLVKDVVAVEPVWSPASHSIKWNGEQANDVITSVEVQIISWHANSLRN